MSVHSLQVGTVRARDVAGYLHTDITLQQDVQRLVDHGELVHSIIPVCLHLRMQELQQDARDAVSVMNEAHTSAEAGVSKVQETSDALTKISEEVKILPKIAMCSLFHVLPSAMVVRLAIPVI